MRLKRLSIEHGHPRINFDHFVFFWFPDVLEQSHPFVVPLDARHPLRMLLCQLRAAGDFKKVIDFAESFHNFLHGLLGSAIDLFNPNHNFQLFPLPALQRFFGNLIGRCKHGAN